MRIEIAPELVTGTDEYGNQRPATVEELNSLVRTLSSENADLKAEIVRLKAQLFDYMDKKMTSRR